MPGELRQHEVEQDQVGLDSRRKARAPRRRRVATVMSKPSRSRPTTSASTKDSSSSARRTRVWAGTSSCRRRRPCSRRHSYPLGLGHSVVSRSAVYRASRSGEGRALALARVDLDPALVVAGDVADDREAEPGAAGRPAPAVVDPVEALEDPLEVAGRDADPLVGTATTTVVAVDGTADDSRRCRLRRRRSRRSRAGCRAPRPAGGGRRARATGGSGSSSSMVDVPLLGRARGPARRPRP